MTDEAVMRMLSPIEIDERSFDDDSRTIRKVVASDESIDSHGSVIKAEGWDLKRFERNPVLDWGHATVFGRANPDDVLGTATLKVSGKKLVGDLHFESADLNPQAEKVYQKIKAKTIRMVSVAFFPKKYHYEVVGKNSRDLLVVDEAELVSIGVVPIGSNQNAFVNSYAELRTFCEQHAEFTGESQMNKVLSALAVATEDEALSLIEGRKVDEATLLSLVEKTTMAEAIDVISTWKKTMADTEAELVSVKLNREIEEVLAKDGKGKVTPAMRASLVELGQKDISLFKKHVSSLPTIPALVGVPVREAPVGSGDGRKWEALSTREKMTISREDPALYQEIKREYAERIRTKDPALYTALMNTGR